jgi:hypothetical protein
VIDGVKEGISHGVNAMRDNRQSLTEGMNKEYELNQLVIKGEMLQIRIPTNPDRPIPEGVSEG